MKVRAFYGHIKFFGCLSGINKKETIMFSSHSILGKSTAYDVGMVYSGVPWGSIKNSLGLSAGSGETASCVPAALILTPSGETSLAQYHIPAIAPHPLACPHYIGPVVMLCRIYFIMGETASRETIARWDLVVYHHYAVTSRLFFCQAWLSLSGCTSCGCVATAGR